MENNLNENKAPEQEQKKLGKLHKPLGVVAYIIGGIIGFVIAKYLVIGIFSLIRNNTQSNTYTTSELINEAVKKIKANTTIPQKLDEVTTMVDITAEQKAIRYHYILSDIDPTTLTNDDFKKLLLPRVCQNKDTKKLLNEEINMEYSYVVKDAPQTFFVSLTKEDCNKN